MQRRSSLGLALVMAALIVLGAVTAEGRVLRGRRDAVQLGPGDAAPLRSLLADLKKDKGAAASSENWGARDWPATRQVATSSGRASAYQPVAAARSYGYASQNAPIMPSQNEPIYAEGWNSRG